MKAFAHQTQDDIHLTERSFEALREIFFNVCCRSFPIACSSHSTLYKKDNLHFNQ